MKKDSLINFVDLLTKEKGLDNLDPEVLTQIKKDLLDRLEDRINAVILEKLPKDKLAEFEKMLDSSSEEEIQNFCQSHIPDLDQEVANELVNFKQVYLSA